MDVHQRAIGVAAAAAAAVVAAAAIAAAIVAATAAAAAAARTTVLEVIVTEADTVPLEPVAVVAVAAAAAVVTARETLVFSEMRTGAAVETAHKWHVRAPPEAVAEVGLAAVHITLARAVAAAAARVADVATKDTEVV